MEENKVKKQPVSLKSLLTPSKTVGIAFPGMEGFEVKLTYLAREELLKLRNRSVKQVLNKRTYNQENAEILLKNSGDFDTWVSDQLGDLENFTKSK